MASLFLLSALLSASTHAIVTRRYCYGTSSCAIRCSGKVFDTPFILEAATPPYLLSLRMSPTMYAVSKVSCSSIPIGFKPSCYAKQRRSNPDAVYYSTWATVSMDSTIWSTAQDVIAECCHASREMAFITAVEPDASSYSSQTFEVACNAGPVKKVSPFCARVFGLDSTIGQCEVIEGCRVSQQSRGGQDGDCRWLPVHSQ